MSSLHWYRRAPGARPLVLVHGFTGAPASWDAVVRALPGEPSVVAPSLPGHHPEVPVEPGFEANLDRLAEDLTRAGIGGCRLAGYSLGARTALGLAVRHPALIADLILIGAHPGLEDDDARRDRVARDQTWIDLLAQRGLDAFLDAWERQDVFATQAALPAPVRAHQRRIRAGHDPGALARSLAHMGLGVMPNYRPHLAALPMPITWVTGERDPKFTALARAAAALMRAAGRPARVVHIPDCGHNPALEAPRALAAILASTATDGPAGALARDD